MAFQRRALPPAGFTGLGALIGILLGVLAGPLLGALAGLMGGLGLAGSSLLGGPGVWVARDLRNGRFGMRRALGAPVGCLVGTVVGMLSGPAWFAFLGWTGGRHLVDVAWTLLLCVLSAARGRLQQAM